MRSELLNYKNELVQELKEILSYWMKNAVDEENGGFYGQIDENNIIHKSSPKGGVLNSRILWTFAAAYRLTNNHDYLRLANRAYRYLTDYFIDKEYGGIYWSVDYKGNPLDTKKQIYATAFAIYGLSEYYLCSKNEAAKIVAQQLYNDIEQHSYDPHYTGYIDAFARNWGEMEDIRLSEKDANAKKTMNTHLHILEAYTNLYRIWPDEGLKEKIVLLINNFTEHIIDAKTHHLILFFDEKWHTNFTTVSYGHDIEAAWLIQEAAEVIHDDVWIDAAQKLSMQIATAALQGLDASDNGLWYEYEPSSNHLLKEKHWWPQAEAMVGFFNAYQNSNEENYLRYSLNSWQFIKQFIKDDKLGEWYWGVDDIHIPMKQQDKAGLWKCPYHNGRACMEIIRRINDEVESIR